MKKINNLEELRAAKKALKQRMSAADQQAKDGFIFSTVNKLFSKIEDNMITQNTPVGNMVNTALGFISGQAEARLKMSKTGKTLFSIAVMVATPIIVKKIQEFVDDKL